MVMLNNEKKGRFPSLRVAAVSVDSLESLDVWCGRAADKVVSPSTGDALSAGCRVGRVSPPSITSVTSISSCGCCTGSSYPISPLFDGNASACGLGSAAAEDVDATFDVEAFDAMKIKERFAPGKRL